MMIGGLIAVLVGAPGGQGVFVGALVSMSSTAVVVKCLDVMRSGSSAYGQITVGTLILQVGETGWAYAPGEHCPARKAWRGVSW
jgi:Kef-type K+ transport system membrane component KefB